MFALLSAKSECFVGSAAGFDVGHADPLAGDIWQDETTSTKKFQHKDAAIESRAHCAVRVSVN